MQNHILTHTHPTHPPSCPLLLQLRTATDLTGNTSKNISKLKLFDIMLCVLDSRHTEADRYVCIFFLFYGLLYRICMSCMRIQNSDLTLTNSPHPTPPQCNRLCMYSVQVALMKWQALSPYSRGSIFFKNMLHTFHSIIELRESANVTMEMTKSMQAVAPVTAAGAGVGVGGGAAHMPASAQPKKLDFSGLFQTWRSRLPATVFENFHFSTDVDSIQLVRPAPSLHISYPGVRGWNLLLHWRAFIYSQSDIPATRNVHLDPLLIGTYPTREGELFKLYSVHYIYNSFITSSRHRASCGSTPLLPL